MSDLADEGGEGAPTTSQRRSGRVVHPPARYQAGSAGKRKRPADGANGNAGADDEDESMDDAEAENVDGDDDDDDDQEDEEEEEEEHDDDDDEDEHDASARRRARSKSKGGRTAAKPRATKKPKLNGTAGAQMPSLPSRPKPKKTVRMTIETDGDHGSQLYADIFSSGDDSDDVAARWYERYQTNSPAAVADLVNCILSAAGCDHHVTEDDINDPDNCSNRLTELQSIYEDQKITDYPLISKARPTKSFRELLVQFFHSFINVLHETEVLYTQPEIMENVVRWVASLSSSTLRPFRHTATTVSLAMLAALVDVARKLDERVNKMTQQVEAQKSRAGSKAKGAKDARLAAFETSLGEAGGNRERVAELMKEFFDTVFVHRYRDVDPRIRTECVEALGSWVWALPAVYMQPEYLRYLGWMLSDSNAATRQEVLRQLVRVFRRDASKMGHFIDRFRPRLIEIATKDADLGVRVAAIAVVEQLRPAGLLDPDEIDAIGQLIFDAELRIRRAAVNFFADCVREFASIKLEDVGGEEAMQELFGKGQSKTGQFDAPRRDWINVKSLANTIAAYETQLAAERAEPTLPSLDVAADAASAIVPETSRISLATQVLVDKIAEIANWEILAGYLLYDHSVGAVKGGRGRNKPRTADAIFSAAVAPAQNEEAILLEILAAAAKASLTPGGESDRFKRRPGRPDGVEDGAETSEAAAMQLATLIPQLLRKFGAEPATAVTVLRLQHSLNLEVFRHLRQVTATFDVLLDEICRQFTRHADSAVVTEAAAALLHARQYGELEEAVDSRVSALWDTVLNSLRGFDRMCELSARRSLSPAMALELSVTLFKIAKLASIADCVDVLEAEGTGDSDAPAIALLVKTVHRGKFEEADAGLDNIEDGLTANAMGACQFYFMWKMRALLLAIEAKTELSDTVIDNLAIRKRTFDQNVVHTFSSRGYNDDLRLYAAGTYCDLHVLFASLRKALSAQAAMSKYVSLGRLVDQVPTGLVDELMSIFDAAERKFAKKTHKTLNEPADDEDPVEDPPEDDEDEDEEDEEEEDGGEDGALERRRAAELKAERTLCDLASHYVMAIVARVLDHSGPAAGKLKRRLLRNQNKLGYSYKEIVTFLDEHKATDLLLSNGRKKAGGGGGGRNRGGGKEASVAPNAATAAAAAAAAAGGGGGWAASSIVAPISAGGGEQPSVFSAPTPAAAYAEDDDDDDLLDTPEPEEGTLEDLRRRELVDVAPEDENEDEDEDEDENENGRADDDDDVLGD